MSIGTSGIGTTPAGGTRARTLNTWAGRSMIAIGTAHIVLFAVTTRSRWGDWLSGELRGADMTDPAVVASRADFWALPGSLAVPLLLLGLLTVRMARTGQEVPRYAGWTLGVWVLVSAWILGPSGFVFGLIPAVLLVLARRTP
ncbi:DUF6463 family protein [Streptomyces sp. NPDC048550]|uniref:DUF6463 family protein n=1 Tax=unclassified Streptomyces TaxID=2593676 RepID=UPI003432BE4A